MNEKALAVQNGVNIYCSYTTLEDVGKLVPNPRNPNKHTPEQIEILSKIIATPSQGFRNPIVVSNRSGFITKGHCRLEAAKMAGMEKVPVDYQDYENEASEWADMLADNKIAELATMDYSITGEVMLELDELNFNLDLTGFDKMEIEGLMRGGVYDPEKEWEGMPQFSQEDLTAKRNLIINFKTDKDVEDFAELVNQKITEKTKSIWYPQVKPEPMMDKAYEDKENE